MTAIGGSEYWPAPSIVSSIGVSTLSAASAYGASIFRAPKTGTIDRILLCLAAVTTGGVVDLRVETVDTSTGLPTGTLWSALTNTGAGFSILSTDDFLQLEGTLIAGAAVTKGDTIALKALLPAASVPNFQVPTAQVGGEPFGIPCRAITGTRSAVPLLALFPRYTDGDYPEIPGVVPMTSMAITSLNNGTSPDERGLKLTSCPVTFTADGVWMTYQTGGSVSIKVYDSADNVLATVTTAVGERFTDSPCYYLFSTPLTFKKGETYRITALPNDATAGAIYTDTFHALPVSARQFPWITGTVRTDAGAWTDQANARYHIGLIVTDVDTGRAGGRRQIGASVARSAVI